MGTVAEFIEGQRVGLRPTPATDNPHMLGDRKQMTHWRCVLQVADRRMTVYFSMGSAHGQRQPTVVEVLDCLASDAATYENAEDFENWARELGYSPDSRQAEKTYAIVRKQAEQLSRLLGTEAYKTLLWDTERL